MVKTSVIGPIFLSASVPDQRRNPKYFDTANISAIREAVFGLAMRIFPYGRLIFGSHPAITPLVLGIADDFGCRDNLQMFASRYFEKQFPPEYRTIKSIILTDSIDDNREQSLLHMRNTMIKSQKFSAAVFIGGMEGVEEEFDLFRDVHPNVHCFPVASTGGAAAILLNEYGDTLDLEGSVQTWLKKDTAYQLLFQKLLNLCDSGRIEQDTLRAKSQKQNLGG